MTVRHGGKAEIRRCRGLCDWVFLALPDGTWIGPIWEKQGGDGLTGTYLDHAKIMTDGEFREDYPDCYGPRASSTPEQAA